MGEVVETVEQRRTRIEKAKLDLRAEEAEIAKNETAVREAKVKAEKERLVRRCAEAKVEADAKLSLIQEAMGPLVDAWNAAIDAGAAEVMFRIFGFAEPGSGKKAHCVGGHSNWGRAQKLDENFTTTHIPTIIEEVRAARHAEIDELVAETKRQLQES